MSVNLSSRGCGLAIDYIEGIQNGQELGALLGYQLERGLHERHPGLELDRFIYVLRDRFPFVSKKDQPGADGILGRGQRGAERRQRLRPPMLRARQDLSLRASPGLARRPGGTLAGAIVAEIDRLGDALDALGDLMLSESVHQVVGGNYARARSAVQALTKARCRRSPTSSRRRAAAAD